MDEKKLSDAEREAIAWLRQFGIVSRQVAAPLIAAHRHRVRTLGQAEAETLLTNIVGDTVTAYLDIDHDLGRW